MLGDLTFTYGVDEVDAPHANLVECEHVVVEVDIYCQRSTPTSRGHLLAEFAVLMLV